MIFKGTNDRIWFRGIPINNYYGYQTDGYFQNQEEIDATSAKFPNTIPGDIKYVDQNGDGILNDEDRVYLGDTAPHYNYSVTLDMRYRNWDFSLLGQGVGKRRGADWEVRKVIRCLWMEEAIIWVLPPGNTMPITVGHLKRRIAAFHVSGQVLARIHI